jgi:hypothetical protein
MDDRHGAGRKGRGCEGDNFAALCRRLDELAAELENEHAHLSAVRSSKPHAMLKFWTA